VDSDLMMVAGVVLAGLSLPSLLNGWTHGRMPRIGALMMLAGAVLIVLAIQGKPGGYSFAEIPDVFSRVIARMGG
jgi:hypothetical protein